MLFASLIMALLGMLLSLWVYHDGKKVESLAKEVAKLGSKLEELEK